MGKTKSTKKDKSLPKKPAGGSTGSKEKKTILGSKSSNTKSLKKVKEGPEPSQGHRKSGRLANMQTPTENKKEASAPSIGAKVYRRKPANIDSSEDDDDERPTKSSKKHVDQDPEQEESTDADVNEGEEDDGRIEPEQEDDLVGLSAAKAKEALEIEQPQWSAKHDNPHSKKDTKSEVKLHKNRTLKCKHGDVTDSGSVESDSSSDSESESESGSESSSGSSDSEQSSDSSEESCDSSHLGKGRKGVKMSKRARDRQSERAKWTSNNIRKTSGSAKRKKLNAHDVNHGWPSKAHYTAPSGRTITLKDQPKRLRSILKKTMEDAEGDILFVNAFPSGTEQDNYISKLLKHHAKKAKNTDLVERIKTDDSFCSALAPLITNRMSRMRARIKKDLGSSLIENTYSLNTLDQDQCQAQVAQLQLSMDYIYPTGSNGTTDRTMPYRNNLIITILRDYIFSGRSSLARKFSERFESSIEADKENVEIPIAMLALVATSISAGLKEWSTGKYKKKEWSTEKHSGTYANHVEFITTGIFKADKKKFHALMSKLYQLASNKAAHASESAIISNAHSNFNIAEMKDDD